MPGKPGTSLLDLWDADEAPSLFQCDQPSTVTNVLGEGVQELLSSPFLAVGLLRAHPESLASEGATLGTGQDVVALGHCWRQQGGSAKSAFRGLCPGRIWVSSPCLQLVGVSTAATITGSAQQL